MIPIRQAGFEPAISSVRGRRLDPLAYRRVVEKRQAPAVGFRRCFVGRAAPGSFLSPEFIAESNRLPSCQASISERESNPHLLEPTLRIELRPTAYRAVARPSSYTGKIGELPGIRTPVASLRGKCTRPLYEQLENWRTSQDFFIPRSRGICFLRSLGRSAARRVLGTGSRQPPWPTFGQSPSGPAPFALPRRGGEAQKLVEV